MQGIDYMITNTVDNKYSSTAHTCYTLESGK